MAKRTIAARNERERQSVIDQLIAWDKMPRQIISGIYHNPFTPAKGKPRRDLTQTKLFCYECNKPRHFAGIKHKAKAVLRCPKCKGKLRMLKCCNHCGMPVWRDYRRFITYRQAFEVIDKPLPAKTTLTDAERREIVSDALIGLRRLACECSQGLDKPVFTGESEIYNSYSLTYRKKPLGKCAKRKLERHGIKPVFRKA